MIPTRSGRSGCATRVPIIFRPSPGGRSYNTQDGIREYEAKNHDYLQQQIGNPDGADKPNKKYYDPRMCLRSAEEATVERLGKAMEDLKCVNVL